MKPKKIRVISIFQTKLTDFSIKRRFIRKCQKIVCGNHEIVFTEFHQIKNKKKNGSHVIHVFQSKLNDSIDGNILYLRKIRLPYKTKPMPVNNGKYLGGALPESQIIAFQKYDTFHGYLNNLFVLNPSLDEFFMNMQMNHGYKPQHNCDF